MQSARPTALSLDTMDTKLTPTLQDRLLNLSSSVGYSYVIAALVLLFVVQGYRVLRHEKY